MINNKKIIIVGKSASGKDYLVQQLKSKGYKISVSYTTRPIREGETNGETYHFVREDKFKYMIENGEFVEYHNFNNWFYGNTLEDYEKNDVFIKTIYGLKDLDMTKCFVIYLDIPISVRKERLLNRKDSNDDINRRIESDEKDFENFDFYDLKITDAKYDFDKIYEIIRNI